MINSFDITDFFVSLNSKYFNFSYDNNLFDCIDQLNFPSDFLINYKFDEIYTVFFDNFNSVYLLTTSDNNLIFVIKSNHTYSFFEPLPTHQFEKLISDFIANFNVPKLKDLVLIESYFFNKLNLVHSSTLELDFINILLKEDPSFNNIINDCNSIFLNKITIDYLQKKAHSFNLNSEENQRILELEKEIICLKKVKETKKKEYECLIGLHDLTKNILSSHNDYFSILKTKKEVILKTNNLSFGFNKKTMNRLFKL